MARPLAVIGITYFLCLTAAALCGLTVSLLLAAILALFFLMALVFRTVRRKTGLMAALLSAVAAFSVFSCMELIEVRPLQQMAGQTVSLRATVLDDPDDYGTARVYTVEVLESSALPAGTRLFLTVFDPDVAPAAFDIVSGEVILSRSDEGRKDLFPYGRADRVFLNAETADMIPCGLMEEAAASRPWYAPLRDLQKQARNTVQWALPGDRGALIARISFGARTEISSAVKADFRGAGLSHLLAVSGLHTSVITGAILLLLRLLRVPRRAAAALSMAGVLFFMGFTGFQPSVMRAGIMNLVLMAGYVVNRRADGLNSLGLAVLLLSLANPGAACDIGLLLSFSATWGILYLCPKMQRSMEKTRLVRRFPGAMRVIKPMLVTVAATIATLPVVTVVYGTMSLVSPISNLVAVPAASVLMILGCLSAVLSAIPLLSLLVNPLLTAAGFIANYLIAVARLFGRTALSFVPLTEPYLLLWMAGTAALLFAGWKLLNGRGMRIAAAFSVIALTVGVLTQWAAMRSVVRVTALDIGKGVALLFEQDGHAGLLAQGDRNRIMNSIAGALEDHGVSRLDFLILPDARDGAAFDVGELLEAVKVDCILLPHPQEAEHQLDAFAGDIVQLDMAGGSAYFWNSCIVEECEGFIRFELGDTRLLICPDKADAARLPSDWTQAHLVVFENMPVRGMNIEAQQGIISCSKWQLEEHAAVFNAVYPLRITAKQGDIQMMTRGRGDVDIRYGGSFVPGKE